MATKKAKEPRFIITDIGPNDAFSHHKEMWIGKRFKMLQTHPKKWSTGWFYGDVFIVSRGVAKENRNSCFHEFKFKPAH